MKTRDSLNTKPTCAKCRAHMQHALNAEERSIIKKQKEAKEEETKEI